jgi:tetratricopeptide (TPR) repeat protein
VGVQRFLSYCFGVLSVKLKRLPESATLTSFSPFRTFLAFLLFAVVLVAQQPARRGEKFVFRPPDPLNPAAFEHFYDMDYDRSIREFNEILQRHPDDPDAINHLLNATLFRELYRIGALNAGEYANDTFVNAHHRPADPHACEQIKSLVQKALALEEKRLSANSKDAGALYSRGVTRAQFATYTALIEHAWFSALRNALGARHDHEKVLDLEPNNVDAKLIVGVHNYVIGNLPWGVKAASSVVGIGGNREKGLEYLHEAERGNTETSIDAKIVLVVFLRRERHYDDALQILRTLEPEYPHNILFALEEGNLLRAKGQDRDAEAVYRRVWQDGRNAKYSGLHYEISAVALGDLLRSEKDYAGAVSAYDLLSEIPKPDPDTAQKAAINAGEMYDLLRKRDLAVQRYQAAIAVDSGSALAETARKRIKEPYTGS